MASQAQQWQQMTPNQMQMMMMMQQGGQMQQEQPAQGDQPVATMSMAMTAVDKLDMSGGLEASFVSQKILALSVEIIGDDEEIELDAPLMESGLTSNAAVVLRDRLSQMVPGINLPATLVFDYPSVPSMTEFIIDKASQKRKQLK